MGTYKRRLRKPDTSSETTSNVDHNSAATYQFIDNRSIASFGLEVKDLADESAQVAQLESWQVAADTSIHHQGSTIQMRANHSSLPNKLKAGVEALSGYSMKSVNVHYNSNEPAKLNAHAFAKGNDIHLGPGQEKHLPHEAWHVVQQKQGRVKPTVQMKTGVSINDDKGLEKEADIMGAKALSVGTFEKRSVTNETDEKVDVSLENSVVQRKIGFEMEYAVPLSAPAHADLDILSRDVGNQQAERRMCTYLTGGPVYDNDAPFLNGDKYSVHIDHELELQRAHIQLIQRLTNDGMMGNWRRGDHHMIAIPEYVTTAFDEMSAYSTNQIRSTLTRVSDNMQAALAAAQGGMQGFPGGNGFYVGVPSQNFKDYYDRHGVNRAQLDPILTRIENAIQDRIAPQATVGIIPSSIFKAHQKLLSEDHMTKDRNDPAISGTDALRLSIDYTVDVMELLENHDAFAALKRDHRITWDELKGMVTLMTNYIVGEAYYRSSGFEDYKAVKNAVPLMSKVWLHTVIESAPSLEDHLTDDMIQTVIATIRRHPYYNADRVRRDMNVNLRTHKANGHALADDATMLRDTTTDQLLERMFSGQAIDHRGQRFGGPDQMIAAVRNASNNQSGIPLEYRRLAMRPNAAGLLNALWPLVEESRELNMRHMTQAQRDNTMWWADTSRVEAAQYAAGRVLAPLRNVVAWGRGLLPQWG